MSLDTSLSEANLKLLYTHRLLDIIAGLQCQIQAHEPVYLVDLSESPKRFRQGMSPSRTTGINWF